MDGDDLRKLPLSMRKANLARLLARRPEGIFISEFEQGEVGQSGPNAVIYRPRWRQRNPDWSKRIVPDGEQFQLRLIFIRQITI
jgi:hypothetical protein